MKVAPRRVHDMPQEKTFGRAARAASDPDVSTLPRCGPGGTHDRGSGGSKHGLFRTGGTR
jgi:hypothetical protein